MTPDDVAPSNPETYYASRRAESSSMGMGLFITAESMFFVGLIGSYLLLKAIHTAASQEALQQNFLVVLCGSIGRTPPDKNFWLPADLQLPITATAINTGLLLLSAYFIYRGTRRAQNEQMDRARWWYLTTGVMGALFLTVQGYEWSRMLAHGLTLNASKGAVYAALFYTIIGAHGVHVTAGLGYLLVCTARLFTGAFSDRDHLIPLRACRTYWLFVCFLWPVLFLLLYFE